MLQLLDVELPGRVLGIIPQQLSWFKMVTEGFPKSENVVQHLVSSIRV